MDGIEKVLKDQKGKGLCFIFDGLDEFSPFEGKESIVYKIISKECLPQSMVIVASRPAALVRLRQKAHKVIEVIGFRRDEIYKYIENYPFSRETKVDELKAYLLHHPNILHMCYLPIHTAMISFLFEVIGKVPCTDTEIYNHFTRFSLMRSFTKHKKEDLEGINIVSLSGEERDQFKITCKLALEITIQNKQVIDDEDIIMVQLKGKQNLDTTFGLITVDRTAGLYGFKNIYTFLHLTYQEYLAAFHISTLSHEDQHELIEQHKREEHMQVVWKFYCGLVKIEEYKYQIKALFSGREDLLLFDIHCAYESQQEKFCDFLIKHVNGNILISKKYLTTTDFAALGYILANTSQPASLSLFKCNIDNQGIKILLSQAEGKPLLLHTVTYESEDVVLDSMKILLMHQCSLKVFKLRKVIENTFEEPLQIAPHSMISLDGFGFPDIVCTSLANLEELDIDRIPVGSKTLSNLLQHCKALKSLSLNYSIEELDIENLLAGILQCRNLEAVSCKSNNVCINISSTPILQFDRLFFQGFRNDKNLTLRISGAIRDVFVKYCCKYFDTIEVLKLYDPVCQMKRPVAFISELDLSALTKLGLCDMNIDDCEAKELATKLYCCSLLQEVHFGVAKISIEDISDILTSLKNCTKLQNLVLNGTYIATAGAHIVASCLQHWPKLQQLHLRECDIDEEGAEAIAASLRRCNINTLEEIELIGNPIEYETIRMILSTKSRSRDSQTISRNKTKSRSCKVS